MNTPVIAAPPRKSPVVEQQQRNGFAFRAAANAAVSQDQHEQRAAVAPERAWAPINSSAEETGPDTFEQLVRCCLSHSSFAHQPSNVPR